MPHRSSLLDTDDGWRIKRINASTSDEPIFYPSNPSSCVAVLVGLAAFLIPLIIVVADRTKLPVLAVAPAGLALLFLSNVIETRKKYRGWQQVRAVCLDHEIREQRRLMSQRRLGFVYRVLLEVEIDGEKIRMTPDTSQPTLRSRTAVKRLLARYVREDGSCAVWIDPAEPRRGVFPRVPRFVQAF